MENVYNEIMGFNRDPKKIEEVLTRGVEEILPSKRGLKELLEQRQIRLYMGVDPTASKLHLGHTIGLRKLQQFADLGHESILVIGTGTVLAGDPSLRETVRPQISEQEIKENIKTWKTQAGKVLDFSKVKIKYNGDWLLTLGLKDILNIASKVSAAELFQRSMFQKRLKRGEVVWTHEILYPLLQGYDSVFMKVDLEIGGTDQVFNMLVGRELEQKMLQKEKFVLTFPMILGTDGKTMSKTSQNCIWLLDSPKEMYGKVMSMRDELIESYFELCTCLSMEKIREIKTTLKAPRDIKARLAREIVKLYHSEKAAQDAEQEFKRVFKQEKLPCSMPEKRVGKKRMLVLDLLKESGLVDSKSQAKRLINQGGIKIDQKTVKDWRKKVNIKNGMVLQKGKRSFVRIKAA